MVFILILVLDYFHFEKEDTFILHHHIGVDLLVVFY